MLVHYNTSDICTDDGKTMQALNVCPGHQPTENRAILLYNRWHIKFTDPMLVFEPSKQCSLDPWPGLMSSFLT